MKLHEATKTIITQFGKGIIHEERFVYILSDLYPERDNQAICRVVKTAIKDNILNDVISSNVNNIEHHVALATLTMSKKYGYDCSLVKDIMYSIAIGYGTISLPDYKKIKNTSPNQQQRNTNTQTQSYNNPNPTKQNQRPTNNQNINPKTKRKSFDWTTVKLVALLFWGILILSISPLIYASLLCNENWWPFPTSLVLAVIQSLNFGLLHAELSKVSHVFSQKKHLSLLGGFYTLHFFALTLGVIFPLLFGIESVQAFGGYPINSEGFPGILTILFNIYYGINLFVLFSDSVKTSTKGIERFRILMTIKPFRNGLYRVSFLFMIVGMIYCLVPIIKDSYNNYQVKMINIQIDSINHQKDKIRNMRINEDRQLSFADFRLGDDYNNCVSIIKSPNEYELEETKYDYNLTINGIDYKPIIDKHITLSTDWNNEVIFVDMFFASHKLFAIKFAPSKTDGDSIISYYSDKYGEPEYHLNKIDYDDYSHGLTVSRIERLDDVSEIFLNPSEYYWTYTNNLIEISYYKGNYMHPKPQTTIIYFDRNGERILNEKIAKDRADQIIREQKVKDSLMKKEQQEKLLLEKKKKREEEKHKESIKMI